MRRCKSGRSFFQPRKLKKYVGHDEFVLQIFEEVAGTCKKTNSAL